MDSTGDDADCGLERFRSYLLLLARVRLDPMVRAKVGASDFVKKPQWAQQAEAQGFLREAAELIGQTGRAETVKGGSWRFRMPGAACCTGDVLVVRSR